MKVYSACIRVIYKVMLNVPPPLSQLYVLCAN